MKIAIAQQLSVVDQLNLSAIEFVYEGDDRGQPPYHPRMMTKILLYGYCVGVFSSRKIQKRLVEDVAFRVLAAGNQPEELCPGIDPSRSEPEAELLPPETKIQLKENNPSRLQPLRVWIQRIGQ